MFNNNTKCSIHATRFIMSWVRMGGTLKYGKDYQNFEDWLKTLIVDGKPLPDEDVDHIIALAKCGKLELEVSAKAFLKTLENQQ